MQESTPRFLQKNNRGSGLLQVDSGLSASSAPSRFEINKKKSSVFFFPANLRNTVRDQIHNVQGPASVGRRVGVAALRPRWRWSELGPRRRSSISTEIESGARMAGQSEAGGVVASFRYPHCPPRSLPRPYALKQHTRAPKLMCGVRATAINCM